LRHLTDDGFPAEIVEPFERYAGRKVLGNRAASGTEIIQELGPEHLATGGPILYTSGDSVFQVAAHEDVWPPEKLWDLCRFAPPSPS
jgi:phosphopentomutase